MSSTHAPVTTCESLASQMAGCCYNFIQVQNVLEEEASNIMNKASRALVQMSRHSGGHPTDYAVLNFGRRWIKYSAGTGVGEVGDFSVVRIYAWFAMKKHGDEAFRTHLNRIPALAILPEHMGKPSTQRI